jgi:hypothetical protein
MWDSIRKANRIVGDRIRIHVVINADASGQQLFHTEEQLLFGNEANICSSSTRKDNNSWEVYSENGAAVCMLMPHGTVESHLLELFNCDFFIDSI